MKKAIPSNDSTISSFPGGAQAWQVFMMRNMDPNVAMDNSAPAGTYTVVVQFIVNTDGQLSDIVALTDNGYGAEEEVLNMVRKSPRYPERPKYQVSREAACNFFSSR